MAGVDRDNPAGGLMGQEKWTPRQVPWHSSLPLAWCQWIRNEAWETEGTMCLEARPGSSGRRGKTGGMVQHAHIQLRGRYEVLRVYPYAPQCTSPIPGGGLRSVAVLEPWLASLSPVHLS